MGDLLSYYSARAPEYEKVYDKPERQDDLQALHRHVPAIFAGRRVLEVACGTGYWTRFIATRAATVTACDLSDEVLLLASARQPASHPVAFVSADAFALDTVPGEFDAAFVGFWWSHIGRRDIARFLLGLNRRLEPASRVVILDNRFVAESSQPVARTDDEGNTYQRRVLESGAEYEVLKNFTSPDDVRDAVRASGGVNMELQELSYYWLMAYEVSRASSNGSADEG